MSLILLFLPHGVPPVDNSGLSPAVIAEIQVPRPTLQGIDLITPVIYSIDTMRPTIVGMEEATGVFTESTVTYNSTTVAYSSADDMYGGSDFVDPKLATISSIDQAVPSIYSIENM